MKLKVEDYFLIMCSALGWSFLGYREKLDDMTRGGLSSYATGNPPETYVALQPESFVAFNSASQEGFPTKIQNFEVLEGSTRTFLFSFFIVAEQGAADEAFQTLPRLSAYLRDNLHEETRIGLSNVAMNTESNSKVLYRLEAFFPLTNSFT